MAELCDHQMKGNRRQHNHKHRQVYNENDFQKFHLNSRVKLPPITSDIPLFSKGSIAKSTNVSSGPGQTEINVSLPHILGQSSVYKAKSDFVVNEQQSVNGGAANKRKHIVIDTVPLDFPKAYTVLPPINSHKQKPPAGYSSNNQPHCRDGKQMVYSGQHNSSIEAVIGNGINETGPSQVRARNNGHKKTQPRSSSDRWSKRINRETTNTKEKINENKLRKDTSKINNSISGEHLSQDVPSPEERVFSEDRIEEDEIILRGFDDGRYILQQLEIHEDLKNFLDSKFSKRRGAVCVDLDSSLGTAADYIRDILLRQTMEELCMMW